MKKNVEALQPNSFYHIYNRGINSEDIFKESRNYGYFLEKYAKYIEPIAKTYAYCLLKNHFHIAIHTRTTEEILDFYAVKNEGKQNKLSASDIISKQFSHLFNAYAQAINKSYTRTGGLFEEPFLRILIENDEYLKTLIVYIHRNPQNHGFVDDFKVYRHTSYQSFLSTAQTKLPREQVLNLFGNEASYEQSHKSDIDNVEWGKFMLDL
ncbi:MAG: transposase [Emticicia sp.]